MSRAPPFPTRQPRTPSQSNAVNTNVPPLSAPGTSTRPLQINRPPSRPNTPSSSRGPPPNTAPIGPSRPARSDLRARTSDFSDRTSSSYRDSVGTSYSDASTAYHKSRNGAISNPSTSSSSRMKPRPSKSDMKNNELETSPTSLNSAMSAFKSAGSRRRAMTAGSDDFEYQREREMEMEAEKLRQQRIRDRAPGRRPNGKARAGDIDAVLDQIKDEWEFVIDPDFNAVDLALQLLDDSSLGKDMGSFRRTKTLLSKALKGSVDKHYRAFEASLQHHGSLLSHLGAVQSQIDESRTLLSESKDALGSKRADLVQLWGRGQTLEEMMRLLDQIDHLKAVPDILETLMSEKRLLQASVLLIRSLKIINKPDMLEIGAVSDLRSYLIGQEAALREILIDELQNHLYLKSFWCESRWAPYSPGQKTFPKVEFEDEPDQKPPVVAETSPSSPSFRVTAARLTRFLQNLAIRPNDPPYDLNDPNLRSHENVLSAPGNRPYSTNSALHNPEADSFAYIETVLESLAVLGRLATSLDIVAQRLPSELFAMVESTMDEVSERAEYGRRNSLSSPISPVSSQTEGAYIYTTVDIGGSMSQSITSKAGHLSASRLRMAALESSTKAADQEILRDLFWTLYSKVAAVAQGLRVTYEVANRIGSRRDFKDISGTKPITLFHLSDIWMSVQAEIRSLIYDHLMNEDQGVVSRRNPISSINESLREGRTSRDKTKAVFRFADTDAKLSTKALKSHEEELTRVIKDTMPGLVQGAAESAIQSALSTVGTDDRLLGSGHQHHKLLIKPDAFHVSVLFEPTLVFLEKVVNILPPEMDSVRASSAVLDDFVLKVYLPQLEEKVSILFHQAVSGPDAFLPDPLSKQFAREPLVKASTQLMALVNSLCTMLQTTPFHQENYSRLILSVVIQFYQRCSDRFQDLVSLQPEEQQMPSHVALAAQWAQRTELNVCLSELFNLPESSTKKQQQLCSQETALELGYLAQSSVKKGDLVSSMRNVAALAGLYRSVSWFASELMNLTVRTNELPISPQGLEPLSALSVSTPYLPAVPATPVVLSLPLTKEMALRFHALVKTYEQLSELILDTIRIDIRCRTLYYLDAAMRHGNYAIDYDAGEPDPHIVDLNIELAEADDQISANVPENARQFIFMGLGELMEHILISGARHLRLPNAFGIKKILRNILALQQSVRTIINDKSGSELAVAKRYYSLFFLTPQEMLQGIRKSHSFSFDEYGYMLTLQCGVDTSLTRDSRQSNATDRNFSMYMIELQTLEIENSTS